MLDLLKKMHPQAECELNFQTPYQLLVAVILSAQCTDKRVNMITKDLFAKWGTPEAILSLSQEELEQEIKSCGFYRMKGEHILEMSRILLEQYGGEVPKTREELTKLPGVGRKTANVVLSNAFKVPAIAVDTHVFRVANRIGLAEAKDVEKTEQQLMAHIPEKDWGDAHHWLIYHGRQVCGAQRPKCPDCPLKEICEHAVH